MMGFWAASLWAGSWAVSARERDSAAASAVVLSIRWRLGSESSDPKIAAS